MRSYEFSAKSVDKAIKLGLETLNKKQEEVDIKIISEGGLFKKAKIVINIEDKPEITNFRKEQPKTDVKKAEVKSEQKEINTKATFAKTNETAVAEQDMPKEIPSKAEQSKENTQQAKAEAKVDNDINKQPEKAEQQENDGEQNKTEVQNSINLQQHTEQPAKVLKNNETSVEFVKGLLSEMNLIADVQLKETKDNSQVTIETEDAGSVIGYRGECLSAIQYLANVVEQKHNKNAKRVVVDAGDYKKKREQQLRDLAIKIAGKVEATGRAHKFEPMNAYERRIIHTELQNYSSVETHSEGEEPHRRLIVTKKAK
ncbi:MAG: RNA-binding cell elongation regulator Jag/EloR [Christensenellales bacterium]